MDDLAEAIRVVCSGWPALVPPNKVSVSQGAAANLKIARPGGGAGFWNPEETPYMVEPTDMLGDRRHRVVCFVGPSQSGKTVALGEGWLAHAVVNDPGDMLLVQMVQDKAREYSKQRIDRAIRNSPALKAQRTAASRDDNLHDKQFRNGMWLRIAWPTPPNLSSTSYRYVFGTDYDRWDDDIGGEGDGLTLMRARTRTFLSRGKVAVESSPGRPVLDPRWKPATPHEAPPVGGILGIYNRGDRRRLHWKCPHCAEWFEASPGLGLFKLPSDDELLEEIRTLDLDAFTKQHSRIFCPTCGGRIEQSHRAQMNLDVLKGRGGWLAEGLKADSHDRISGTPRVSDIASYWLGGVAAAYIPWADLVGKHLAGLLQFDASGDEEALKTTANTDQSVPYTSRALLANVSAGDAPQDRTDEKVQRYIVPDEARFLVAEVDVQGGSNAHFAVQVNAIGPHRENWIVDRFTIKESKRRGAGDGYAPIDPAAYAEDWDVLTDKVVKATYRTSNPEVEMRIKLAVVDSGGEDGVTERAYAWWRRLRANGLQNRVRLTKGDGGKVDWLIRETMVGGKAGRGDVPLILVNTNKVSDAFTAEHKRTMPGPGYWHFPAWLPQAFFDEVNAEVRLANGVWSQVKPRNEAHDQCRLCWAAVHWLGCDRQYFWDRPPAWAAPRELNSEVVTPEVRRAEKAEAGRGTFERRVAVSPYMRS